MERLTCGVCLTMPGFFAIASADVTTARDQAVPVLVLAGENENRVASGDKLAAIHRLLCGECERLRPRIENRGLIAKTMVLLFHA